MKLSDHPTVKAYREGKIKGSDAEQHVRSHFAHKEIKIISNGIRPASAAMFLESLPLVFQPGQSEGLNATYHFTSKIRGVY